MPITMVLKRIQTSHQLMTFVVDEHGSIMGFCTLENVLEKIVGPVDDEFDAVEEPQIRKIGKCDYLVQGNALIREIEQELDVVLDDRGGDTVAGALMARSGKLPEVGDKVVFDNVIAEVIEVSNDRADKIRFVLTDVSDSETN
jgi:CBS domain containing-hemolysin-like protein